MTRTLTPGLQTAIAGQATAPSYLAEIDFPVPDGTVRLSSRGDITVDSQAYASGLTVSRGTFQHGRWHFNLQINNSHGAFSPLLSTHGAKGHVTRIYKYYVGQTKLLLADGVLDGGSWNLQSVRLTVRLTSADNGRLPRIAMVRPFVNWMPVPGETFAWGGTTYTITE